MKYIQPDNIGKIIGKSEIDTINFIRVKLKKSKLDDKDLYGNCIESWKMLIGWLQWKYGDKWMEYIPLIAFASNQVTLIATAITED